MTGGAEINFGGAREVYLCEFERGTEHGTIVEFTFFRVIGRSFVAETLSKQIKY